MAAMTMMDESTAKAKYRYRVKYRVQSDRALVKCKLKPNAVFADVKSAYDPKAIADAGYQLWRL